MTLIVGAAPSQPQEKPPLQEGSLPVGVYDFEVTAAPTELQEGEPLTLTLRITGTVGSEQPRRPNLRHLAEGQLKPRKFDDLFYLEIPGGEQPKRPAPNVWEYTYLLRPKSTRVESIPILKFTFLPAAGAKPRHNLSSTIPLTVKPRSQAQLSPPVQLPAIPGVFEIVTGDAVLRHESPSWWFTPPALALLTLTPPLICLGWYVLWRRLHPNALRIQQRRHRRAMWQAVRALKRIADPGGDATATVVARYLQQRFDFLVAEPTPAEVAACLQQAGASADVVRHAAELMKACDDARFAPEGTDVALAASALQFIQKLEADLCAVRSS